MSTSILIAQHQAGVALDLEARLLALGYQIAGTATNLEEVCAQATVAHPDLVLLDTMFRGLAEKLSVPVVFLGSDGETNLAADVVVEPYRERELHTAIEFALFRHSGRTRLRRMTTTFLEALNYIDDPIFAADESGNVTFMNPPARRLMETNGSPSSTSVISMIFNRWVSRHHVPKGTDRLSRREHEILGLFLRGFGTSTIGLRLGLNPQTVRNHLKNVCKKLDVRSQVELRELFIDES